MNELKTKVGNLESKVDSIEKTVIRIENDHGRQLAALSDGYKQNYEKLERIEKESLDRKK